MATGTAERGPQATPPAKKADGRWIEYDQFIDKQIRKARGQVKGVELAGALMTLAAGGLLYFLLVSVTDHWLVTGGLGFWGRLAFFVLFLTGAGWYIVRRLAPLAILRINPIYAAETIEKSKPSLKNSLINFLFLRDERSGVPQVIYQAVEEQAVSHLQRTPIEATVDRTKVIQIGYVLLAVVALFAAYKLFSPKDPLDSIGRVVMPWADIQAPTRVTILDVLPGDRATYLGESVEISAEIRGIGSDEPVRILYTTRDRQTVDEAIVMYRAQDAFRHTGKIPSGDGGLQQDIEYRIEAGDAISQTYRLEAAAAPTIAVESLDFEYPDYTKKAKLHVENAGDIQALEGTKVTIRGRANQPLHSAQIVLDGEGRHQELPLKIDGRSVMATFVLRLDEKDRATPEFARYQLRPNGRAKPEPAQFKIVVFPDLPPEIKFLAPENDEVVVAANGSLVLELRARDPDYALSEVRLSAEQDDKLIVDEKLLAEPYSGPFQKKFTFQPAKLGLKEGDSVNYWATANDNRTPTANEAHTAHRQIRIVKALERKASNDPAAGDQKNNPADENKNPHDDTAKPNDPAHQDHRPKDPNEKPGPDAENQNNNSDNKRNNPNDANQADRPQDKPSDKPEKQQGNEPQDGKQPDGKQQDGKQQDGKQQDGKQQDDKQQQGENGKKQDSGGGASGSKSSGGAGKDKGQSDSSSGAAGGSGDQKSEPKSGGQSKGSSTKGNDPSNDPGKNGGSPDNSGASGKSDGSPSGGNEQPSPSSIADAAKAMKQSAEQQDKQGPGSSGKSPNQPSPAQPNNGAQPNTGAQPGKGAANSKGAGGDGAADGHSQNPSADPQGSGGPFPNGQPGTGSEKSPGKKPASQQSGPNQPPGDKPKDASSGQPDNKPNGSGEKNGSDKSNSPQNQPGQGQKLDASQHSNPAGDAKTGGDKKPGGQNSNDTQNAKSGDKHAPGDQPQGDKSQTGDPSKTGEKPKTGDKAGDNTGDKAGGKPQPGEKSQPGEKAQPGAKSGQETKQPATDKSSTPNGDKTKPGDQPSTDKRNSDGQHGENQAGKSEPDKQGEGDQAKAGSQPSDPKRDQPEDGGKPQPDAKGGDPQTMKGNPSAGQKSSDSKGSPNPDEGNRPKENKTDAPDNKSPKSSDSSDSAKSPTTSPKESNSQGQEDGDRTGNGKPGGGESSKQAGTGGAGEHTASDEGKGKAEGKGKGEDGNKAGTDKPSDKPTGQPGDKSGEGSATSDKPSEKGAPSSKPGDQKQGGGGDSGPWGGNRTGPLPDGGPPGGNAAINGDEANKEFAQKQFDMALDRLKKGNPDLLKELNWSPDDARKLAERFEQMKAAAQTSGPEGDRARHQMDDLLRNLGSRAGQLSQTGDRSKNDNQRGVREANDSGPPADYLDQFEAFQQGTLRGGK